jgi:Protein of unknown function (DUF1592)/Protein of unknown function (DUF1588)/Protein of unknown function (DUF1587)/Protein of unknown function (DUF1585)/Protein of unknown function (DUF1595)
MNRALAATLFAAIGANAQTHAPAFSARPVLDQYCAGCHNENVKSGGMTLTGLNVAHPLQSQELAEKAIRRLRAGLMPPSGAPRPDQATIGRLASFLENRIDQEAALHPNPGRPALHRLNRTEYANSIRDLLNLEVNTVSLLPPDDMSHGFDNMAGALMMSPALMEAYIRAASKISREAVGDPAVAPSESTYQLSKTVSQTRHVDGTPLGTRGGMSVHFNFPADGEYVFKMSFYYSVDGPLFGRSQGKGQQIEVSVDGARVALLDIDPARKKWDEMKTPPVRIAAGPRVVAAAFLQNTDGVPEDVVQPVEETLVDLNLAQYPGVTVLPHLHDFVVSGPFHVTGVSDTPSRKKIFSCRPAAEAEEIPCAKKIISTLARQAFRRPVNDADLEDLLSMYQAGRNERDFDSGIRMAVQAMIANPGFVYRFERTPGGVAPGRNYRVTDLELASRLSYFLWSSAPDSQLLTVASQGHLREPLVLEKQVRRMLADPRADALVTNFASQWLHLQDLNAVLPDVYLYTSFSRNLVHSMRRETELFFGSVMREDRDVLTLLDADYTFVDELLAKHYGIPNILGSRFRRVPVTDPNRRGLLGQASLLSLTSVANRTSPVMRGKYVMEVLLGTPPPPPPGVVPALKEATENTKPTSVRERLEEHRANAVCATCHKMMDPIGFALENFDPVGAWRINDSGFPIDAHGKLFDGTKLDGPASLRRALLNHSDAFLGTFTENLFAYGVGRVLETSDMTTVREIEKEAARNHNRFSSFILGIVRSPAFQMRRAEDKSDVSDHD